jgi:hypothetical protein
MPVTLATWEAEIKRIRVSGQPRETDGENPISKITRAKRTGCVAQVVELLLCRCKAPNPRSIKINK